MNDYRERAHAKWKSRFLLYLTSSNNRARDPRTGERTKTNKALEQTTTVASKVTLLYRAGIYSYHKNAFVDGRGSFPLSLPSARQARSTFRHTSAIVVLCKTR